MDSSTQQQSEQNGNATVGGALKSAREQASYSIEFVASQTHLHTDIIVALEQDRFDELPGDVFVRGYIRAYAKVLGIDASSLIDTYESIKPDEPKKVSVSNTKRRRISGVDPVVIWSTTAVAIILVGLVVSWWTHYEAESPVELTEAAEQFDDPLPIEEPAPEKSSSDHQVSLGNLSPEINSSLQAPGELQMENEETPVQTTNSPRIVPAFIEAPLSGGDVDKVRITVRYKEESWTEIFDARKRRLLHGLIQPGAIRVISGQAPFNVFLGNSPGVELEINGKPFDHSSYIRRNNTARFLIDDTNS